MKKTKDLTLMAMFIALYIVLEQITLMVPIFSMPQGGKLALSAIALVLASYKLGFVKGLIVAITSLLLRFVLIKPPYFISFPQLFLDYFLAYSFYSMSVLFKDIKINNQSIPMGVLATNILRYLAHSVAGVMFFPSSGTPMQILYASFAYNFPYMFATAITSFIVVALVKERI